MIWFLAFVILVSVCGAVDENEEKCKAIACVGVEYECVGGRCYCADGFALGRFHEQCVKCPGIGEPCYGQCCSQNNNITLHCVRGVCRQCYDSTYGHWMCRPSFNDILLNSTTQIAMASALVLGIFASFALIYKLCAVTSLRPLGFRSENRLSIGSLQVYIDERLRNAPPKYSSTAPKESSNTPTAYINSGFTHDNSVPPPLYTTDENKLVNPEPTLHL